MQTKVMGVLRVVPDEFADGDRFPDRAAVARGRGMISEGADIIEVACGSVEAGRPAVDPATEERAILGVVEALAGDVRVAVATRSAAVAAAAVAAGATLLTDSAAAPAGDSLPAVAAAAGAGWVAVHDAGAPSPARDARASGNGPGARHVVGEMIEALGARVEQASAAGVAEIYVDPGIGTGRAANDDLDLLGGLDRLAALGRPLVVGTGDGRLIDVLHAAADAAANVAAPLGGELGAVTDRALRTADAGRHGSAIEGRSERHGSAIGGRSERHGSAIGGRSERHGSAIGGRSERDNAAIGGRSEREIERLEGALVVAVWAMLAGAAIVRTHHVAATTEAARIVGAKPPVGTP